MSEPKERLPFFSELNIVIGIVVFMCAFILWSVYYINKTIDENGGIDYLEAKTDKNNCRQYDKLEDAFICRDGSIHIKLKTKR